MSSLRDPCKSGRKIVNSRHDLADLKKQRKPQKIQLHGKLPDSTAVDVYDLELDDDTQTTGASWNWISDSEAEELLEFFSSEGILDIAEILKLHN